MSTLKKSLGYQTIYQVLNTCLPLITSPYLARTLGASQQGVFSYTQSIVNYFTLIAMLGVVNYGTRTIAACGNDKKKRSEVFWNIYSFQGFTSLIALAGYGIYLLFFCRNNMMVSVLQCFYLWAALLDVSWLFFGVEKFDVTVKRSVVIRLLSFACILGFVNRPEDLWIYTIIMSGSIFLSNLILWKYMGDIINFGDVRRIRINEMYKHIKPNFVLFVPLMAMSVFHVMDKTMLGLLSTYEQTGFYYNADKIINIPIGIITGVGTVMLPRMTALTESGQDDESTKLFNISLEIVFASSAAMAFGIAAISKEFTPIFFGKGFDACINLIIVLAPVLIIKSLSQTSRMQYLIPQHKENIFIQSVFLGAFVNLGINFVLIPRIGAMGAVIGTLLAELASCIWQYVGMRRSLKYGKVMIKSMLYVVFGLLMFISVRLVADVLAGGIVGILAEIITGGLVYLGCCLFFWKITNSSFISMIFSFKKR